MTSVKISTLENVSLKLFQKLREDGFDSIDLEHDFYWAIDASQTYDTYDEPKAFTVGQLSEDWNELEKIASGEVQPIAFAFVWLASIYKKIGQTVVN